VSRDRRAIREKIETEPKIRKLVSGSHQAKYLSQDLTLATFFLAGPVSVRIQCEVDTIARYRLISPHVRGGFPMNELSAYMLRLIALIYRSC
jgi:hypothetical protein